MVIIEDTLNKHLKHNNVHEYCEKNGIEIIRHRLLVGDYTLPADQRICIDTKMSMVEVSQNIYQDHKRFQAELMLAQRLGIKLIVLIEDETVQSWQDLLKWTNPQPNATALTPNGERCYKVMKTMENTYGCRFEFCRHDETGSRIIEILKGEQHGENAI